MAGPELIEPDWPAPPRVRALSTARRGGFSGPPYASLNVGMHVGDDPARVMRNRASVIKCAGVTTQPGWLDQVHGTTVADFDAANPDRHRVPPTADASVTTQAGRVCVIMTADCLPILFADLAGSVVAAAHGGWRGLAAGVVEATVAAICERGVAPGDLIAWLGPAIGPAAYEVGSDVADAVGSSAALVPGRRGHWQLDLYGLARERLVARGVGHIHGGDWCTHSEPERFFSHRRDGVTGRHATMVWLER